MRRAKLLIACPEFLDSGLPLPDSMGFEYDKVLQLPGGGISLGYYNMYSAHLGELSYGLPKDIRDVLWREFESAIDELCADEPVNLQVADFVTENPCDTWITRLRNQRIPARGRHAQSHATMREVLKEIQSRRTRHGQPKLKLAGLKVNEHWVNI